MPRLSASPSNLEDDGNRRRCAGCRDSRRCEQPRRNTSGFSATNVLRPGPGAVVLFVAKRRVQNEILALDPAQLAQSLTEGLDVPIRAGPACPPPRIPTRTLRSGLLSVHT
jgi:hypothetical protein